MENAKMKNKLKNKLICFLSGTIYHIVLMFIALIILLAYLKPSADFWPGVFGNISIKISLVVFSIWMLLFLMEIRTGFQLLSTERKKRLSIILAIVTFVIQIFLVFTLENSLTWDNSKIYDCAISYVKGTQPLNDFLGMYPHQAGASIETVFLIDIMKILHIPERFYIRGLSCCMVLLTDCSMCIFSLTIKRLFVPVKARTIINLMWFFSLLSPTITIWGGYYYPTVLSLPFFSLTVYFFILFMQNVNNSKCVKNNWINLLLGSLAAFVGYHIRATIIIVVIAFWCAFLYKTIKEKIQLRDCVFYIIICVACWGAVTKLWSFALLDFCPERNKNLEFPLLNWIMIGVEDGGAYNYENAIYIASIDDYQEKENVLKELIRQKVKERGFAGMVKLYEEKIYTAWSDGNKDYCDFFSQSDNYTELHQWIIGPKNGLLSFYGQIMNSVLFIMIMFGIISRRKRISESWEFFLLLIYTGSFLFYLIWEVQGHYNISIEPLKLMLSAIYYDEGLTSLEKTAHRKIEKIKILLSGGILLFSMALIIKSYPYAVKATIAKEDIAAQVFPEMGTMKVTLEPEELLIQSFYTDKNFSDIFIKLKNNIATENDVEYDIILKSNCRGNIWVDHILGREMPIKYFFRHSGEEIAPKEGEVFYIIISASKGHSNIEAYSYQLNYFDLYQNGALMKVDANHKYTILNADIVFQATNVSEGTRMSRKNYVICSCFLLLITLVPAFLSYLNNKKYSDVL